MNIQCHDNVTQCLIMMLDIETSHHSKCYQCNLIKIVVKNCRFQSVATPPPPHVTNMLTTWQKVRFHTLCRINALLNSNLLRTILILLFLTNSLTAVIDFSIRASFTISIFNERKKCAKERFNLFPHHSRNLFWYSQYANSVHFELKIIPEKNLLFYSILFLTS